jgi:hypothetical protein
VAAESLESIRYGSSGAGCDIAQDLRKTNGECAQKLRDSGGQAVLISRIRRSARLARNVQQWIPLQTTGVASTGAAR